MKKITSLLTLLLLCCMSVFAQDLEKSAIIIGEPQEEFAADTWYLLYQRRGGDGYAHYENATTRFYKRAVTFAGDPLTDGMKASLAGNWLVRFTPSETDGQYWIQFANGAYWVAAGTSNSSAINPGQSKYDATSWSIYRVNGDGVDGTGKPVFGINIGDKSGARLDNNGNGGTLSIWDSGELTDVESNAAWSIVAVDFTELDERDAAMKELQAVYGNYSEYDFTAGTEPGNYGVAEVEAFNKAMDAAAEADGPSGDSLTAEDLAKMAQDIKDAYDAVIASRVPFACTITPGYYYIKSALDFKTVTTTEATEDPETGEEIPGESVEVHHVKAMYADGLNGRWAELDDAARQSASYIWHITEAGDKKYHLINTQVDAQFKAIGTSANITLSEKSDSLVVFDTAGLPETYNIRLASQAEHDYYYIHCGGHGGGAGVQGNLVGWCNTVEEEVAHASEWQLEAIDEATALAIIDACSPQKQIKAMTDSAAVIVAAVPATIAIAQDKITEVNSEYPLIQSVEQLSSPMTEPNEGSIAALIDGDAGTFWHSQWSGRQPDNGVDYIQIEMTETDIADAAFVYTRRAVQNDHLTKASVYGTNDAEAEKNACELLATVNLPFTNNSETLTSDVFPLKGYQYIRIYEEATTNNRGYFHMAELQMYPASVSTPYATTQAKERAAEISAIEAAIEAWKAIDLAAVKQPSEIQAQFDALTKAYAAWQAVYVDPAALRAAINNAPDTKAIKLGTNPGEWSGDAAGAVTKLVAAAQAYDESGKYTPAESEKFVADLAKAGQEMLAAANQVKTGKWYNIRFATEAEYEAAGWDKTGAQAGYNEAADVEFTPALFGKYASVAKWESESISYFDEENNEHKISSYTISKLDKSENATMNASINFMDKANLDADMALWQFIAVGDSAYAIQNKGTGLYMRTSGTSGSVYMSVQPTLFNVSAIGYGENLISGKTLAGANQNNLHAQRDINLLVTWSASAPGTNSGLMIEEVEDVTEQPSTEFTWRLWPGRVQTICYPVELKSEKAVLYTASVEGTTVTLNPMKGNTVAAGKAAVMILGSTEDYEEIVTDLEDENYNADAYELCKFTHGTEFVAEADATGTLRGSFVNMNIGSGNIWAEGNSMVMTKKSSNVLGANTAYIEAGITDLEAEITFIIENSEVDGIQSAIANVSKVGDIYTADGKYVGRGNLNSLKTKGLYIVNGTKVLVK